MTITMMTTAVSSCVLLLLCLLLLSTSIRVVQGQATCDNSATNDNFENETIFGIVCADDDLQSLCNALKQNPKARDRLREPGNEYVLYAPTDEAFSTAAQNLPFPSGTVLGFDSNQQTKVLLYHMVTNMDIRDNRDNGDDCNDEFNTALVLTRKVAGFPHTSTRQQVTVRCNAAEDAQLGVEGNVIPQGLSLPLYVDGIDDSPCNGSIQKINNLLGPGITFSPNNGGGGGGGPGPKGGKGSKQDKGGKGSKQGYAVPLPGGFFNNNQQINQIIADEEEINDILTNQGWMRNNNNYPKAGKAAKSYKADKGGQYYAKQYGKAQKGGSGNGWW